MRRAAALLLAALLPASVVLAACGAGPSSLPARGAGGGPSGHGSPTTPATSTSTAAGRQQEARRAAQALLASVALPPGARASAGEPAGDGGRLSEAPSRPALQDLVDLPRFAVVVDTPAAALAWVRQHVPKGSSLTATGESSGPPGAADLSYVVFSWPGIDQLLDSRAAVVSVTALAGGGTGVRVDALVTWLPAKPGGDLVPAGATVLTAVLSKGLNPGEPGHPLTTTTDRSVIATIRDRVDALPVVAPGAHSCPADFGQTLTLRFYAGPGEHELLATVVADAGGCGNVTVTTHGRHAQPALAGGGFASFVAFELGWRTGTAG